MTLSELQQTLPGDLVEVHASDETGGGLKWWPARVVSCSPFGWGWVTVETLDGRERGFAPQNVRRVER